MNLPSYFAVSKNVLKKNSFFLDKFISIQRFQKGIKSHPIFCLNIVRSLNMSISRRAVIAISAIVLFVSLVLYFAFSYMLTSLAGELILYSNNWSGYAVALPGSASATATTFSSISASWIVPAISSATIPGYSSVWLGIGGFLERGNRLIQAGTEQDISSDGSKNYYAWFEALPQPTVNVGPVSPGDLINARISRVGDSQSTWRVTLSKESKGIITTLIDKDITIRINSESSRSAEFMVEAPALVSARTASRLLPLSDFRAVMFSNCTTNLGGLDSLTKLYRFIMTSDGTKNGIELASPSALSANGFKVNRTNNLGQ